MFFAIPKIHLEVFKTPEIVFVDYGDEYYISEIIQSTWVNECSIATKMH